MLIENQFASNFRKPIKTVLLNVQKKKRQCNKRFNYCFVYVLILEFVPFCCYFLQYIVRSYLLLILHVYILLHRIQRVDNVIDFNSMKHFKGIFGIWIFCLWFNSLVSFSDFNLIYKKINLFQHAKVSVISFDVININISSNIFLNSIYLIKCKDVHILKYKNKRMH